MVVMNIRCPHCDTAFECSPSGRACWCTELPPLPIAGDLSTEKCLCRNCLEERVADGLRQRRGDVAGETKQPSINGTNNHAAVAGSVLGIA